MACERAGSLPVYYDTETGEYWVSAVLQDLPCGCSVTGGGNLPSPLKVKHCEMHAAPRTGPTFDAPAEFTANPEEAFSGRGRS